MAAAGVKSCFVRALRLQKDKDYKQSDIAATVKLTKEEKTLVLDKKKRMSKKEKAPKTPAAKKDKKPMFQMKLNGFFSPPSAKKEEDRSRHVSLESRTDTPDSGFASRADSEAPEASEDGSPKKEDAEEDAAEEEEGIEAEKKKFLDDLDESESESEKEESSSEDESEDDFDPNESDDGKKKGFEAKKPAAKKKLAAKRKPGKPLCGALQSEMKGLSEYEKIRDGNIKEREAMLAALMSDFSDFKNDSGIGKKKAPPKKRKRVEYDSDGDEVRAFHQPPALELYHFQVSFSSKARVEGSRKSSRISNQPEDKDKLGSEVTYKDPERRGLAEEGSGYDSEDYQVNVSPHCSAKKNSGLDSSHRSCHYTLLQAYEDRVKKRAPRPGQIDPNDNTLMPEDVTPAMLKKICERFGDKTYNQTIGTSCHQCRQKTTDTKTICR